MNYWKILTILLFACVPLFSTETTNAINDTKLKILCFKKGLKETVKSLNNRYEIINVYNNKIKQKAFDKNNILYIEFNLYYPKIKKINEKTSEKNMINFCKKLNNTLEYKCMHKFNHLKINRIFNIFYDENKKIKTYYFNENCDLINKPLENKK